MKKIWIAVGLIVMMTGCASQEPASSLIEDAQSVMNDDNAKNCAAETYALAQKALDEAKKAQAGGDVETARQKARLAQTLAKQAKDEAELNLEDCRRRNAASEAVAEILAGDGVDELAGGTDPVVDSTFQIVYFDFDEAFLSTAALNKLQNNIDILKAKPDMKVILAAHSDDRGTTEYNLALSQKRGDVVREHVIGMGIDASRLSVVPYGKERLASTGTREQDHALNRRVEFISR